MEQIDNNLYEHIQSISFRLCCNKDTYMDLAHDACVKVLSKESTWDHKGSYKAWASIVAANSIIDTLRREGKRADFERKSVED